LVFLPLRKISAEFTEILRGLGIAAEHVDGESKDRACRLHRFHTGETRVLCNAMLLAEGYDEAGIDAIMDLSPTKSRSLYAQRMGRGTRICEGKENLLILDPMWMSERHSLIKPAHLVAETDDDARAIVEEIATQDAMPHLPDQDESVDLLVMATDAIGSRMESIRRALAVKRKKAARKFDPITYATQVMESMAAADYQPSMEWEAAPPTEKQITALGEAGMHLEPGDIRCAGHASALLDQVYRREEMGLATTKQLFYLHQLQIPNANSLTKSEAGAVMGERFGGGNKRPKKNFYKKRVAIPADPVRISAMDAFAATKNTYKS
jgi:superfamily II DNA/RNA helicase